MVLSQSSPSRIPAEFGFDLHEEILSTSVARDESKTRQSSGNQTWRAGKVPQKKSR